MANPKQFSISFRPALPDDAKTASRLMFDTFAREATFFAGLGSEERAKKILARLFSIRGHRLSYEFTEMIILNGQVAGIINCFPGKDIGRLNSQFGRLVMKQYQLRGKIAFLRRSYHNLFIQEAERNEFHLGNLAVKPRYRGKGVAGQALAYLEERAREAGFLKISLAVDIDNQTARQIYEKHGYRVKSVIPSPKKHIPYLGSGNMRMVKELDREG